MLLSVVIPVYNEAEVLPTTLGALREVLSSMEDQYELVFVNDGSRDASMQVLRQAADADPRVRVLCFSRNFGHQAAVTAGLDFAAGDAVVVMDADLQDPPVLLPRMVELYKQGYEVVSAQRLGREGEGVFKRATAALFYWGMRKAVDERLVPHVGDFRLFSRSAVEAIRHFREEHRFMRGLVAWLGLKEAIIPFRRHPRAAGTTKYPLRKMLRFAWTAMTSFSGFPLRLCLSGGVLLTVAGVLYTLYVLYSTFVSHATVPGWTSLVCLQVIFSGAILVAIGLLGDYVARIYEESKGRPLYVLSHILNPGRLREEPKRTIVCRSDRPVWAPPTTQSPSDGGGGAGPSAPASRFDALADEYAQLLGSPIRERFAPGSRFFADRKLILLRDFLGRQGQDTHRIQWLDVGCGQGELLRLGQPHFAAVAGCDVSAKMLRLCQDLPTQLQDSPERLPFPDGAFDLVTAVCLFHHVGPSARPSLAREVSRVLKPGGIFCIIEHNPFNPVTRLIVWRTPVDDDARLLTASKARGLVRAAGLEVMTTRYFLVFPERLYPRLRRWEDRLGCLPLGGQYAVFGRKGPPVA